MVKTDGTLSATGYLQTQKNMIDNLEFAYGEYKTYQVDVDPVLVEEGGHHRAVGQQHLGTLGAGRDLKLGGQVIDGVARNLRCATGNRGQRKRQPSDQETGEHAHHEEHAEGVEPPRCWITCHAYKGT